MYCQNAHWIVWNWTLKSSFGCPYSFDTDSKPTNKFFIGQNSLKW